ncbi:SIR2 family protein, partial [Cobetia amphilecti]|uniref:SIR2 family protein n=1 Tax=Cobetia amphilecti TaxID=1055104 RepID=UPI001427E8C6
DTEDLIITRSDYFKIKREHSQFYNVMDSLLTVNTILFLGCGMDDPDIQLILENTIIAAHSDHPHYAVLPAGKHRALKRAMENAYNIRVLEYQRDDDRGHGILLDSLKALREEVDSLVSKLR